MSTTSEASTTHVIRYDMSKGPCDSLWHVKRCPSLALCWQAARLWLTYAHWQWHVAVRSISTFSPTQYNGPRCYSSWVVRRLVNGKSGPSNVGVLSHVNIFRSPIKQWLLLQWPSQKIRRRHLSKGFLGLKVGYQIKAQKKSCRTLALDVFFQLMSRLDFVMSRLGLCHVETWTLSCRENVCRDVPRLAKCQHNACHDLSFTCQWQAKSHKISIMAC